MSMAGMSCFFILNVMRKIAPRFRIPPCTFGWSVLTPVHHFQGSRCSPHFHHLDAILGEQLGGGTAGGKDLDTCWARNWAIRRRPSCRTH